jgi:hypothetical protein
MDGGGWAVFAAALERLRANVEKSLIGDCGKKTRAKALYWQPVFAGLKPCAPAKDKSRRSRLRFCRWGEEAVVDIPFAGLAGRDVEVDVGLG